MFMLVTCHVHVAHVACAHAFVHVQRSKAIRRPRTVAPSRIRNVHDDALRQEIGVKLGDAPMGNKRRRRAASRSAVRDEDDAPAE